MRLLSIDRSLNDQSVGSQIYCSAICAVHSKQVRSSRVLPVPNLLQMSRSAFLLHKSLVYGYWSSEIKA